MVKMKDNLLASTAIFGYLQTVTTGNDETSDILRIMQQSQHVYYATSSNYGKHQNFANKYGFVVATSRYQVNEAVKKFDAEFESRRNRELGAFSYLILDAHHEKRRQYIKVANVVVLSAIGVDRDGNRRILGLSVAPSEEKIHWKEFLEKLIERGLCGVEYIDTDNHAGLITARRAVFPNASWQRYQFHLT